MVRTIEQWMKILEDLPPKEAGLRLTKDLTHYRSGCAWEFEDSIQIGNAMEAWANLKQAPKEPSLEGIREETNKLKEDNQRLINKYQSTDSWKIFSEEEPQLALFIIKRALTHEYVLGVLRYVSETGDLTPRQSRRIHQIIQEAKK